MRSEPPRIIVIPDIHGCCRTFRLLMQRMNLTGNEILYLLGDYIDRGPDSCGVIEEIMTLKRDGFDVRPVLGNHEDLLLKCLDSGQEEDLELWLDNGGDATLESYGVQHPQDIDRRHLEFMRNLPLYHLSSTHVFVHAGLNFCVRNPLSPKWREAMLWQRTAAVERGKIGGRIVISGHTVMQLEQVRKSLSSDHIRLDNGCFTGGHYLGMGNLVALELATGELSAQRYAENTLQR